MYKGNWRQLLCHSATVIFDRMIVCRQDLDILHSRLALTGHRCDECEWLCESWIEAWSLSRGSSTRP